MELLTFLCLFILLGILQCSTVSGQHSSKYPQSCASSRDRNTSIQGIHPQPGFGSVFSVACENSYEGGGWIVIQQRFNGSVYFYRDWTNYENGFGNIGGEFWLGLKKIHELTYSKRYELHVILEDWEGASVKAKYSRFLVGGPSEKYVLKSLGEYSGTAGDSLSYSLGMKFSTLDADNDASVEDHCAQKFFGAWWYKECHESNLNGLYRKGKVPDFATSMCWKAFRGFEYGLKTSRMLIREVE